MDRLELQKLRDLPIEGVAERLGLQVVRHKALCPFHDDHHASLSFSVRRNTYRCFVCGASGGTIDLVMHYLNKPFLDACRWLDPLLTSPRGGTPLLLPQGGETAHNQATCPRDSSESLPLGRFGGGRYSESLPLGRFGGGRDWTYYARFFEHPFLNDEARRFLFEERRLDPRVVRWCRLTSWRDKQGVPWLQIPYYDREGKLVGIQNRNLSLTPDPSPKGEGRKYIKDGNVAEKEITPLALWRGAGGEAPRFRFPQGSRCSIYNLPVLNLLKPGEALYITEGCSDCWAMLSAGHKAIAIPSATLLSKKDKELLSMINKTPLSSPKGDTKASPWGGLEGVSFHMFPDRDAPGERLFLQLKEVLPSLVHHQLPPGCKDYSDYYLKLIQLSEVVK